MSENSNSLKNSKLYNCDKCEYNCSQISDLNKHFLTKKHKKNFEEINKYLENSKKSEIYNCEYCNFFTKKPSAFNKHLSTIKHKEKINPIIENAIKFNCKYCDKEYTKNNSCTKHEKICILNKSTPVTSPIVSELSYIGDIFNRLIQENQKLSTIIIEQNQEFMKKITDLTITNNTNNNNTVNSNNTNKFNINLFLNEKCKDAINFADFIKNIEVSHDDLENNAQLGFANGISKIIIDNLKQLSIYDRPIHCSDVKRETMYIKNDDKWTNEEDTKKLTNAIQDVSRKSVASLLEWQETNPEFEDMDSEFSNKFITMMQQSIAGNKRDALYPKVIRTLAKEIMIDKNI